MSRCPAVACGHGTYMVIVRYTSIAGLSSHGNGGIVTFCSRLTLNESMRSSLAQAELIHGEAVC